MSYNYTDLHFIRIKICISFHSLIVTLDLFAIHLYNCDVPLSLLIKDNLFMYLLKVATATWLNVIHTSVKELHYDAGLLMVLSHHEVKKL